jgi:parallel beta-helix repeat protein
VPFSCSGVAVSPGANLQGLIDANPGGTTFCFAAGTYRLTSALDPKSNDVFIGAVGTSGGPGAALNGSKVVTNWVQSGTLWYSTGQTQERIEQVAANLRCMSTYTGCIDDDDLYFDSSELWQVTSKSELVPGTFYFDYAADTIWIADNPSGHLLEASVAEKTLIGSGGYTPVSGVQFKGFLVEKFSTPAQVAAVTISSGGRVEGNEIRLVHGVGVTANATGASILHNYIHDIGQMGVSSAGGINVLWQNNEIARTNTAGYNSGWEGGGGKLSGSINNTFDKNYSHDNGYNRLNGGGSGIWEDGDSFGNIFSNNYISGNASDGIALEISYNTKVFGNTIVGNGGCTTCGWGAGVYVANTSGAEVYSNYMDSNKKGVLLENADRGSGTYGIREINNDYIHDNVVKMPIVSTDTNPYSGFKYSNDLSLFTVSHAHFEYNSYYLVSLSATELAWNAAQYAKDAWMGLGQDTFGKYYGL